MDFCPSFCSFGREISHNDLHSQEGATERDGEDKNVRPFNGIVDLYTSQKSFQKTSLKSIGANSIFQPSGAFDPVVQGHDDINEHGQKIPLRLPSIVHAEARAVAFYHLMKSLSNFPLSFIIGMIVPLKREYRPYFPASKILSILSELMTLNCLTSESLVTRRGNTDLSLGWLCRTWDWRACMT